MAFCSFLTLPLAAGMAAAGPCYVSGTTTALTSETTTATTSSFYSSETTSTSATLTAVSSDATLTTATFSTSSSETATISTSSSDIASTTASLSSETETTSATTTTFSSTESASTAASAITTSSAAPDPDCYKHIKILRGQSIGGVSYHGDSMALEQCMDACADVGNCIAFDFMSSGGWCYISYTGQEGNLWGPPDDDMYTSGYTNTC
ncbi:hypothetical protein NW757_008694 [Fusarium falciforme]|nr:hypothetical protein NW757_008694 [Fusarium falciforme]